MTNLQVIKFDVVLIISCLGGGRNFKKVLEKLTAFKRNFVKTIENFEKNFEKKLK